MAAFSNPFRGAACAVDRSCPVCGWTRIDGQCACGEWKLTSNERPPEGIPVLCSTASFSHPRAHLVGFYSGGFWFTDGGQRCSTDWEPAWWRPLPEPPPTQRLDGSGLP